MQKQRMIIISLDAVGARDMDYMESLSNFSFLKKQGAFCKNVESVYPSITYPAHASIITGKKPMNHGIINNICLQPGRISPDWLWYRKYIKGTTLYDEARKSGMTTAAHLWPVTAGAKIKYHIPEIFANRPWQNQVLVSAKNGKLLYQINLLRRFGHLIDGVHQPQLDNFVYESAVYTIDKYNPDLFLIHFTDVDTNRHLYGLDSLQAKEAMQRHDKRLGGLLEALHRTGDMSKTTVVVLGDHCQINTHTILYPNYYLKKEGFIRFQGSKIRDYDYIAQHCDGSCYIYASKNSQDGNQTNKLLNILKSIKGVKAVYSQGQAKKMGADPDCVCMLEAEEGFYFQNEWEKPKELVEDASHGKMKATHGYQPNLRGYQTFFLMNGFGIKAGIRSTTMHLWDEGVTMAKILGITIPDADGQVLEDMISI